MQNTKELKEMREQYGVALGSLQGLQVNFKQLHRNGLSKKQIHSAIANLHPRLMANLAMSAAGIISVKDEKMVWKRNKGWLFPCKRHDWIRWQANFYGFEERVCVVCPAYERRRRSNV